MKKYRVNEIFYSIQGEGRNTGRAALFVRMSGCNLKCPFCDTAHHLWNEMTAGEICDEALKLTNGTPGILVVLTGGEPTLQVDEALVSSLHETIPNCNIAIETNGTHPVAKGIDWITLSPKDIFVPRADILLTNVNELKVVFDGRHPIPSYDNIKCHYRYVQPCDTGDATLNTEIIQKTIDFVKSHPQWAISLQTHKYLGVR